MKKLGFYTLLLWFNFCFAFLAKASPFILKRNIASTTEAQTSATTECQSCAQKTRSNLVEYLSRLPAVQNGDFQIYNTAVFGNDARQSVGELRQKRRSQLTLEEKAILEASSKIGFLGCRGGGANGTLIKLPDGRDAILASAHGFVDHKTGRPKCDFKDVRYMANPSFNTNTNAYDPVATSKIVQTDGQNPINLNEYIESLKLGNAFKERDFLIFPLSENISNETLPDGTTRGYMKISSSNFTSGTSYMIGSSQSFHNQFVMSYESCSAHQTSQTLRHSCASLNTSSSSALLTLNGNEMQLIGINTGDPSYLPERRPLPENIDELNYATPVEMMRNSLK